MFEVVFFRDAKGCCPVLEALDNLPDKARVRAEVRIERLAELGNQLKRPEADYLDSGIYELRWRLKKVQYRLLYFFAGTKMIVLSHIITKEGKVPQVEIDKSVRNKFLFEKDPLKHTYIDEKE